MSTSTPIQVNISGFSGKPQSLFSVYNNDSGVLAVAKLTDFKPDRVAGCFVIGNDPRYSFDMLFDVLQFNAAVDAYYSLKSSLASDHLSPRLAFGDNAMIADPVNAIQHDGYGDNGAKYRFDSITNAQACALATCFWAIKASNIESAIESQDDWASMLLSGRAVSVGGATQSPSLFGFTADSRFVSAHNAKAMEKRYGY